MDAKLEDLGVTVFATTARVWVGTEPPMRRQRTPVTDTVYTFIASPDAACQLKTNRVGLGMGALQFYVFSGFEMYSRWINSSEARAIAKARSTYVADQSSEENCKETFFVDRYVQRFV